jgi:GT2 family glycosyltransferase
MTVPDAGGRPRFSVVVPVFNKAPFLREVIGSLAAAIRAYGDGELIAVDHESTDGSSEILASVAPGPNIVLRAGRGTIAAARNQGAALAGGSHLCFVDADCVVPVEYLSRVAEVLGTVSAEAVGCRVRLPAEVSWVAEVWDRIHASGGDGYRLWLSAAAITVERRAFESIGGYNEAMETQEDVELCSHLRRAGFRIWESHQLAATHLDNPETLRSFLRKEAWRARGAFGRSLAGSPDRPTLAMYLHLALIGVAVALMLVFSVPIAVRCLAVLALAFSVPIGSVAFRAWRNRQLYRPFAALVLYQAYYLARLAAFVRSLAGRDWMRFRPRKHQWT